MKEPEEILLKSANDLAKVEDYKGVIKLLEKAIEQYSKLSRAYNDI